ncbi:hypothetical protein D0T49_00445 [Paludibacter sp. 221]|nr:hypothetical protein [Paludibacter sp. 221]
MKNLTKKMDELAKVIPIIRENAQRGFIGGTGYTGTGTVTGYVGTGYYDSTGYMGTGHIGGKT